jgi:hypothetical protein
LSLRGLQQALARIYTDGETREAFLSGAESSLAAYDLSPRDLQHLRQLRENASDRLEFFCGLLTKKQSHLMQELLPLTYKTLRETLWNDVVSAYSSTVVTEAVMSPTARAVSFLDFLESHGDWQSSLNLLQRNIVLYERCKLSLRLAGQPELPDSSVVTRSENELANLYPLVHQSFLIRHFDYDLTGVIRLLNDSATLTNPPQIPTSVFFYRQWRTGSIETAKIAEWLEQLLNLCNGQTAANSIVERVAEKLAAVEPSLVGMQVLCRLKEQGVITFLSRPLCLGMKSNQ